MQKILIYLHIIHLLKSSTCFEHYPAHLQEVYDVIVYAGDRGSIPRRGHQCSGYVVLSYVITDTHYTRTSNTTTPTWSRLASCSKRPALGSVYTRSSSVTCACIVRVNYYITKHHITTTCICSLWYRHSLQVTVLCAPVHTRQSPADSDNTRGCIYTITT
jgi:hypothetical protein